MVSSGYLDTRFLVHLTVTSPSTNQKKVTCKSSLVALWLRIQCCHCCGAGLTPGLGTSTCWDKKWEKKLHALQPSLQILPPKTTRAFGFFFEHEPPILLAWLCNKPLSAPNSKAWVCLASLCVRHTNLHSVMVPKHIAAVTLLLKL